MPDRPFWKKCLTPCANQNRALRLGNSRDWCVDRLFCLRGPIAIEWNPSHCLSDRLTSCRWHGWQTTCLGLIRLEPSTTMASQTSRTTASAPLRIATGGRAPFLLSPRHKRKSSCLLKECSPRVTPSHLRTAVSTSHALLALPCDHCSTLAWPCLNAAGSASGYHSGWPSAPAVSHWPNSQQAHWP